MHDLGDMLVDAGFADPVLDQETITLRWKSGEALLGELRQLGGNTAPARHPALRTPARRWPSAPAPTAASASASRSRTGTASSPRRACAPTLRSRCPSKRCGQWCEG